MTSPSDRIIEVVKAFSKLGGLTADRICKETSIDKENIQGKLDMLVGIGAIEHHKSVNGMMDVYTYPNGDVRTTPIEEEISKPALSPTGRFTCPVEGCEFTSAKAHGIEVHVARTHKKRTKDLKEALDKVVPPPKKGKQYVSNPEAVVEVPIETAQVLHIDVHDDVPVMDFQQTVEVQVTPEPKGEPAYLPIVISRHIDEIETVAHEQGFEISSSINQNRSPSKETISMTMFLTREAAQ